MALADIGNGLQISWRRRYCSQRRSAHWFKDESCDIIVTLRCGALRRHDSALQLRGILLSAVVATVCAIEGTAITIWNADVLKLAHHRQIDLAPLSVAGH